MNPETTGDLCGPDSTVEEDAIRGKWVLVPRNLNREGGYLSRWLVRQITSIKYLDVTLMIFRTYTTEEHVDRISTSLSISRFSRRKNLYQQNWGGTEYPHRSTKELGSFRPYTYGIKLESKEAKCHQRSAQMSSLSSMCSLAKMSLGTDLRNSSDQRLTSKAGSRPHG